MCLVGDLVLRLVRCVMPWRLRWLLLWRCPGAFAIDSTLAAAALAVSASVVAPVAVVDSAVAFASTFPLVAALLLWLVPWLLQLLVLRTASASIVALGVGGGCFY